MRNIAFSLVFAVAASLHASSIHYPEPRSGERVLDFVVRWDKWVESIPENQKASRLIFEVESFIQIELDKGHWFEIDPRADDEESVAQWIWAAEYVGNYPELIQKIREYASRPLVGVSISDSSYLFRMLGDDGYGIESGPHPKTFNDIVPSYNSIIRSHIDLLLIDMHLANESKDFDRSLLDIQAIANMARLIPTINSTLDHLVVGAIGGVIARRILWEEINIERLNDTQLVQLSGILHEIESLYDPASSIQIERLISHEFLDWIYEDSADGKIAPLGVARLIDVMEAHSFQRTFGDWGIPKSKPTKFQIAVGALLHQQIIESETDQRELLDSYYDAVEKDLLLPIHELDSWTASSISRHPDGSFTQKILNSPALFAMGRSQLLFDLSNTPNRFHAAQLLISLQRHLLRHRVYPTEFSAIDIDLYTSVPIDLFSGQALKFKVIDGKPVIYSVGTDRDDDGGKPIFDDDGEFVSWVRFITLDELDEINETNPSSIDGDWVLYPMTN